MKFGKMFQERSISIWEVMIFFMSISVPPPRTFLSQKWKPLFVCPKITWMRSVKSFNVSSIVNISFLGINTFQAYIFQ